MSACRDISQQIRKSDKAENIELMTDYFAYIRLKNTVDRFLAMAQQVCLITLFCSSVESNYFTFGFYFSTFITLIQPIGPYDN